MLKKYLLFIILTASPSFVSPECIGCMTPCIDLVNTELIDGTPGDNIAEIYIKKCMAKQKHIEGDTCDFCKCPKAAHSVHKHPYKIHNNKKASEMPIETILPKEQTKEEKSAAIKTFLTTGILPSQTGK
ncbi:MAG: hypothetical protein QG632_194 [Candidatus Dependentiae bacterium]|nr:hypothetical protein [Candidatus Dependentiae bacterium]